MSQSYHLLLGERDFQPLIDSGGEDVSWDRERRLLTLAPELMRFPARASERIYTAADRRGAAADAFGHLYWIDDQQGALRYSPAGSHTSGELWSVRQFQTDCAGPHRGGFRPVLDTVPTGPSLRGLAVTTRGYLVVGTLAPGGLLIFDLHQGGPPRWHRWPETLTFAPFDMTAAPDGGLWILDLPAAQVPRLWYLDCALRVGSPAGTPRIEIAPAQTDEFRDLAGMARTKRARAFPTGIPVTLEVPLAEAAPVAIEALPDGSLLLLDQGPLGNGARVHRLECGSASAAPVDLNIELRSIFPDETGVTGHDLAFLADSVTGPARGHFTGTLYIASAEGNQSFAFRLDTSRFEMTLEATPRYLPMRRYAGKALVSGPGEVYYDQAGVWLMLTELPRPRYARSGRLGGLVFDGKEPQCQWHRLFIDGCVPPGDAIGAESRAADDTDELARAPWRQERTLYLRGINRHEVPTDQTDRPRLVDEGERPFHRPFASHSLGQQGVGTWELLLQEAQGRYLELRLTLTGSGRSSPKVQALRVYYPRLSYPRRFLPAVYREDPVSASFLERFLANFEGFYTELEQRIATVQTLFDGRTAPAEALEWLASWLGAGLAEDWEESRRRLFIRHAVDLYRQRGTAQGLVRAIRLATEPCPDDRLFDSSLDYAPFAVRIHEHFGSRSLANGQPQGSRGTQLPSRVSPSTPWEPSQGGARLHRLWRDFLFEIHAPSLGNDALLAALGSAWGHQPASIGDLRFSPLTPGDPGPARDRSAFIDRRLGLTYAELGTDDTGLYRSYLKRKHGSISALNSAYALAGSSAYPDFESIGIPQDRLPADGAALEDWFQFATVDVVAARYAHRFTVLVPVEPSQGPSARQQVLDRVHAVVERERPTHASFDVKPYWALFRVGSARAGLDTVLSEGSRFTSLVLNAGYIGEGLLAEDHPWNLTDRWVSGRDSAGERAIG